LLIIDTKTWSRSIPLLYVKPFITQTHLVGFNQLFAVGIFLALENHAFIPSFFSVGAATTNGFSCLDAKLFLGLILQQ
jgi:hypothetical protein